MKAKNLRKEINGERLFESVNFEVHQGEHLALFGKNGSGKTTLLKGLLGQETFDEGIIHRNIPVTQWGWLSASIPAYPQMSVKEYVLTGMDEWYQAKKNLGRLQKKLEKQTSEELLTAYETAYNQFIKLGGYELEVEAEKQLNQLSVDPTLWSTSLHQLSGGQKTKAQLAKILIQNPDFLLMDEPTNHLDQDSLVWLEDWVKNYPKAILFVSHDRYFLDQTAHAIVELRHDGVKRYPGGYTAFRTQKEIERREQARTYKKYEQKKKEVEESIRNYQQWFQKAHKDAGQNDFLRSKAKKNVSRLHAKESELERLEKKMGEKPRVEKGLNVSLEGSEFSGRKLAAIENLTFSYGEKEILKEVSLTIQRGDRIAITGPNGAGKSTLLKLLAGKLSPDTGDVRLNPQTRMGYFDQELEMLNREETLLDNLLSLPDMTQTMARTILGSFMFRRDTVHKTLTSLSMGEKCRAAFIKLYFSRANLLILDEPTNFLDISAKETIEEALMGYPGAIIFATHDRYLVKKLANRVLYLDKGGLSLVEFDK
ncbi:ribosomal protection-like ABC-F family protein [Melghiribacillus thermohalophilus]|nr:ABC-F type ribosomal protection protein [Melghiribacillus thermohalophilus]